ncbi:MAG: glutaredoxin family protein [Patescibacteria group bacterium]
MLKKLFFLVLMLLGLVIFAQPTLAQQPAAKITLYLFYGEGCPHCAKEKEFLEREVIKKFPNLEIKQYEIYKNQNNSQLMYQTSLLLQADVGGVPFTVIGDQYVVGYAEGITDRKIIDILTAYQTDASEYYDLVDQAKVILLEQVKSPQPSVEKPPKIEATATTLNVEKIKLPILGEINPQTFSLPIITILLAAVDGFNPCAMWTLLFLISLLLGMEDRKKMLILGGAFIFASATVYFLFLAAWLNLFLFLGVVSWVKLLVGLIALGAGGYYLYDFMVNKDGACQVTGGKEKSNFFNKLKQVISNRSLLMAVLGIMVLAVSVNLIELVCSAGLPAIYTQILSLSGLSPIQYYFYLLLYILIFMLDDLLIFFLAMTTLRVTGIQGKYARFSHLIGGVLMLIIGLLLLFKPEWLMFG